MSGTRYTRRDFVKTTAGTVAAGAAGTLAPYWMTASVRAEESKNNRPLIGCISCGDRWTQIIGGAMKFGDVVAVCDVDRKRAESGQKRTGGKADIYEDYRKILDRKDVEIVTIVTPDHWHSKIAIEAMKAGKDIYCEKPLTLTIDEGKQICKVHKESKSVFQVGTQQRSEMELRFLKAIALVHAGRIGKLVRVTAAIDGAPSAGPFQPMPVPPGLNWDFWLGQAPLVPYTEKRCFYEFRWWYEYSGGKMTDWGAHHVDIATWGMKADHTGPISIEGAAKFPNIPNGYNTATSFNIHCKYADGVELVIRSDGENGITFEGENGSIFVSRGKLTGKAVDEMKKDNPLPPDALTTLYKGKKPGNHMGNFFECVKSREEPISDVYTHHRALTTCHLANIAIRLNRKIQWDPAAEQIVGDSEANSWLSREQRAPYKIEV